MATEKWGVHWEVAQKDDGTWIFYVVDPETKAIKDAYCAAWVALDDELIDVELHIIEEPPLPTQLHHSDGSYTMNRPFDIDSVRMLVADMVIRSVHGIYRAIKGKTLAQRFTDRETGEVIREYGPRPF